MTQRAGASVAIPYVGPEVLEVLEVLEVPEAPQKQEEIKVPVKDLRESTKKKSQKIESLKEENE